MHERSAVPIAVAPPVARASGRRAVARDADHLHPHPWTASPHDRAGELRAALQRRVRDDGAAPGAVCITDEKGHLIGQLGLAALLSLPADAPVGPAARTDLPIVLDTTLPEDIASTALHHRLTSVPLVDAAGRLVGVVEAPALMDILRREHIEDLHRIAGISREEKQARRALEAPPLRRLRHRLPWLLVGLAGSALATFVVSRFEAVLAAMPAVAFFVPALVYLADAIGTQTEAIAVRGLSLSRVSLWRVVGGEARTGVLIGLVLGLIAFPMVWLAFGDTRLALAVSASLAGASAVASMMGLMLPWALQSLGSDPAYGSGPLATILQDVMTLLMYFGFVTLLIGRGAG